MSKMEDALKSFEEGYSCAQSVISAYSEQFGLERNMAIRIAGAFGGGIARRGEMCGAVTGALMVIGLANSSSEQGDLEAKDRTYRVVHEFVKRFEFIHDTIVCKDLLGHDLSTEEGQAAVKEQQLTRILCPNFVKTAMEILEELSI